VYHFDWVNDFSAAKNFALEKTLSRCDFCLSTDSCKACSTS
jgi:hypothetical protein